MDYYIPAGSTHVVKVNDGHFGKLIYIPYKMNIQ